MPDLTHAFERLDCLDSKGVERHATSHVCHLRSTKIK